MKLFHINIFILYKIWTLCLGIDIFLDFSFSLTHFSKEICHCNVKKRRNIILNDPETDPVRPEGGANIFRAVRAPDTNRGVGVMHGPVFGAKLDKGKTRCSNLKMFRNEKCWKAGKCRAATRKGRIRDLDSEAV